MRTAIFLYLLMFAFTSCKKLVDKNPSSDLPLMHYTNLNNITAGKQQPVSLDIDNNGTKDVSFSYLLVGDALNQQDKHQFYINGAFNTYFPVDLNDQCPSLQVGEVISPTAFPGHSWYNASAVLLAQKIISMTGPVFWDGKWKNASQVNFPFYLKKGEERYFGWIRFSFDTGLEKIIIHDAAVSKEAAKHVKAGIQ